MIPMMQWLIKFMLRRKSGYDQDQYFMKRLVELVEQLEAMRNETELPDKIARYNHIIGLCNSAIAYLEYPALIYQVKEL